MNYAVDYAPVGETIIARWEGEEKPTRVTLKSRPEIRRLVDGLKPDDTVWMELGGAAGVFATLVRRRTKHVFRTPTFGVKDARDEWGLAKADDCLVIARMAATRPELFYPMRPVDDTIVELQVLVRKRQTVQQDARIPAQLRLQQIARDTYLLEEPEEDFRTWLRMQLEEVELFRAAMEDERRLNEQIADVVETLDLYHEVFAPVVGIGPVIGGRLIAGFVDIHLYPTPYKMLAYTGWHLRDGQVPKRRHGRRTNWNRDLNDALSKWQIQMLLHRGESAWRDRYESRKVYERGLHPEPEFVGYSCFRCLKDFTPEEATEVKHRCPKCGRRLKKKILYADGHIHRRALRYVTQRLVTKGIPDVYPGIWRAWRAFEGLPTTW